MKQLIKLQSLINSIERETLSSPEYYSTFLYKNQEEMVIKTYCEEQTFKIWNMFKRMNQIILDIKGTDTIEVLDLTIERVDKEHE